MIVINIVIVFLLGYLFVKIRNVEKQLNKEKTPEQEQPKILFRDKIDIGSLWSRLYGKK